MDDFLTVTVTGVSITTGAASSGGALPVASSGEIPRYVRVAASVAACVRIGVGAQTAVATDLLVQPGDAVILAVPRGCTHVAAIQLAAAGVVIVTPLEDC
jgi:aspartate/methionine/tyrosine aminotransferase